MIIYKPVWFLYFLGLGHSSLFVQGLDQGLEDQYADFQWLFPGNNSVIRIGEVYTSGIIWFSEIQSAVKSMKRESAKRNPIINADDADGSSIPMLRAPIYIASIL